PALDRGRGVVDRGADRVGDVVRRPRGHHADGGVAAGEGGEDLAEGAVTAGDRDDVLRPLPDRVAPPVVVGGQRPDRVAVPLEQLAELPGADRSPRTGAGVVEEEDVHDPCPYPHRDPPTPRHPVTCTAVWGAARRGRCRGRSATEDRRRALITNDAG